MLQGAYTFGRAMNDADIAVGATAFQDAADIGGEWAVAGYDAPTNWRSSDCGSCRSSRTAPS